MDNEFIDIRVRLQDAQAFLASTEQVASSVRRVGTETETANLKAKASGTGFGLFSRGAGVASRAAEGLIGKARHLASSWAGAAKGIVAAGAAFLSFQGIKSAAKTTEELAVTTLRLHRNLGLNISDASAWSAVAQQRGISNTQLSRSFTTLGKQIIAVGEGQKKPIAMFQSMGISVADLTATHGDFHKQLLLVADALGRMPGGAQRAAAAQMLLGRGSVTLLPLFAKGSKSINENINMAKKYGDTLSGGTVKSVQDLIKHQHESQYAWMGLQVTLGTFVIPIITKLLGWFSQLVLAFRQGTGVGKVFHDVIGTVGGVLRPVIDLFKEHKVALTALATVLGIVLGLFLVYKAYTVAATVATGAWSVVTTGAEAVMWLFNAALDANPIGIVVLAIAAFIAIGVLLIRHWKEVSAFFTGLWRDLKQGAVDAWNWVKGAFFDAIHWIASFVRKYWPEIIGAMTGGIALLPALIIQHWNEIKRFMSSLPGWFVREGKHMFIGLADGFIWVVNKIIQAANWLIHNIGLPGFHVGPFHFGGFHPFSGVSIPLIPFLAEGGMITSAGAVLVGERGPEVLSLPRGAQVAPLPLSAAPRQDRRGSAVPLHTDSVGKMLAPTVVAKVYLDKRQIAEAVGEVATDGKARR